MWTLKFIRMCIVFFFKYRFLNIFFKLDASHVADRLTTEMRRNEMDAKRLDCGYPAGSVDKAVIVNRHPSRTTTTTSMRMRMIVSQRNAL